MSVRHILHPLWAALCLALVAFGCPDRSLLSGKECDPQFQCMTGYFCDIQTNLCVKDLPPDGGDDGGDGQDGDDGGDVDDGDGDAGDGDVDPSLPDPIVLYTFVGLDADQPVPDLAPLPPEVTLQAVERQPLGVGFGDHQVSFSGGLLAASAEESDLLIEHLRAAGSFSLAIWTNTNASAQQGPARLMTLSSNPDQRAFTLAHDERDLVIWLVTGDTDPAGLDHELRTDTFDTGHTHQLALVYDGATGRESVYVDGQERDSRWHRVDDQPADLPWPTGRDRLGLGNELDLASPWSGTLFRVGIYDTALSPAQMAALFALGWDR